MIKFYDFKNLHLNFKLNKIRTKNQKFTSTLNLLALNLFTFAFSSFLPSFIVYLFKLPHHVLYDFPQFLTSLTIAYHIEFSSAYSPNFVDLRQFSTFINISFAHFSANASSSSLSLFSNFSNLHSIHHSYT